MARIRVALCQLDTVVGDIEGNAMRILGALGRAGAEGADVVAFPELAVTGYPPEDLLLKPAFVADNLEAIARVAEETTRSVALVGFVDVVGTDDVAEAVRAAEGAGDAAREDTMHGAPRQLRNAVAVCARGRIAGVYHKRLLPNYGVFDEERWFGPGVGEPEIYEIAGIGVGVSICEDLWLANGPIPLESRAGARLVVNVNASPYSIGRFDERLAVVRERVEEAGCAIAYVNQVGGQDELVFDGGSMVVDQCGALIAAARRFTEEILVADLEFAAASEVEDRGTKGPASTGPASTGRVGTGPATAVARTMVHLSSEPLDASTRPNPRIPAPLREEEEVYEALVIGTRDYLAKNGFSDAVIGLSGGIDSSLVAAVAVDALGRDHVHGMSMPSRYSSEGSLTDAAALAENLGIELHTVAIEDAHVVLSEMLTPVLAGPPVGLCDENLQSRIRGVLLMAVSNANGWIVLTTGNKSELATGYSTLYGDSAGGFAVIKDVPKTLVYRLCRHRNEVARTDLVPRSVLEKAPSAELRPDQRDDQSLPPYDLLDPIIERLVTYDRSIAEVSAEGFDTGTVTRVARLIDSAEYKRRQSPPGVRISVKAFGKDRRVPITNRYRDKAGVEVGEGKVPGHAGRQAEGEALVEAPGEAHARAQRSHSGG